MKALPGFQPSSHSFLADFYDRIAPRWVILFRVVVVCLGHVCLPLLKYHHGYHGLGCSVHARYHRLPRINTKTTSSTTELAPQDIEEAHNKVHALLLVLWSVGSVLSWIYLPS